MDGKATQINTSQAESKRSAQWVPVYSWLESLDKTEIVKSREISEWLSENPEVKEQLYWRYTHQRLMHYIQKCHSRLLKRSEKGKESSVIAPLKSHEDEKNKAHVPLPCNSSSNIAEGNDKYSAKRNEAFLKYNTPSYSS